MWACVMLPFGLLGLTVRFTAATPSEAEDWVTVLREAIKLLQISDELKVGYTPSCCNFCAVINNFPSL